MISTATYSNQHPTSTCPNTAAFCLYPVNMSIAWTHPAPSVHFLEEFGHVSCPPHRCGVGNLGISSLRVLGTSNTSKTPTSTPARMPTLVRSCAHRKPGVALTQDAHTSSGLSLYGLGIGICHKYCLDRIVPQNSWTERLINLLRSPRRITVKTMGFPSDKRKCPIWSIKPNQGAST